MTVRSDHIVDASGLICPEPIMLLHGAVRDAQAGDVIELISTDPATKRDVQQFCAFLGHELVAQKDEEGEASRMRHFIKRMVNK